MEDKRLLRLIKKARFGDKEAFSQLIKEKSRKIVFVATNLMGNRADGEDVAQEAVITLARKIGTLKKAELFDAWMYRIIYNVCMDEKRKQARKLDASAELDVAISTVAEKNTEVLPEKKLEEKVKQEEIMEALNQLSDRYRMCMILFYYEDMSYAEIAETLQVSEQVVANTLNRAKEKLRDNLSAMRKDLSEADLDAVVGPSVAAGREVQVFDSRIKSSKVPSDTVVKAGAFLPVAAISQAFATSEATTVLPGAVASVTSAAAAVVMPKGLLLNHVLESVATKAVAGLATLAILTGGTVYAANIYTAPSPVTPFEPIEKPAPEVEKDDIPASIIYSARVDGLPEGSSTTILAQGKDEAALQEFKGAIDAYEFLTTIENEGYVYLLYRSIENPLEYILTIERSAI